MNTEFVVEPLDLRRNIGHNLKNQIVAWSDFLADADRLVVHAVFLHAQRLRTVAAARRVSADTLRKKLRKLVERVTSAEFQFIAGHLSLLPPPTRAIAQMCILQGQSIAQVAKTLRLTPNYVRQQRRVAVPMLKMIALGIKQSTPTQGGGVS